MDLAHLARITSARSRRSSSWDRTGGNNDNISDLAPGATQVLLDTGGPGRVTHLWLTYFEYPGHTTALRDLVLRMYWEGSAVPSVEVPLGDFFGLGHALPPYLYYKRDFHLTAAPITVGSNERSFNCYWPMPFRRHARIELCNNGERSLRSLYFHVDHELGPQDPDLGLFHAVFRQERELASQPWMNLDGKDNYVLLETEGRGHYVGGFLYVDSRTPGWYGEGDDMIFIDRDPMPTINGTGTEDYFCNAWGFAKPFTYPWYGVPLIEKRPDGGAFHTWYRFHGPDPVRFERHIRVTIEHQWGDAIDSFDGGAGANGFASTAFWYQERPIAGRAPLPAGAANHPRRHPGIEGDEPAPPLDVPALEVPLRALGLEVATVFWVPGWLQEQEWLRTKGGVRVRLDGRRVQVPLRPGRPGRYRVEVQPIPHWCHATARFALPGGQPAAPRAETLRRQGDAAYVALGEVVAEDGAFALELASDGWIALQGLRAVRLD
ncbi:MAG: DUF2961 domain-containing protein [Planctomycetes bacterium]|nr:DUF2961 domain-containing protein [Planctomycetota bacterium]